MPTKEKNLRRRYSLRATPLRRERLLPEQQPPPQPLRREEAKREEVKREEVKRPAGASSPDGLEPWEREPRWWRGAGGVYYRVAYERHGGRSWVGGRGYVYHPLVSVWNPESGATREEVGAQAGPGERFAVLLTPGAFERLTSPLEDLPPPLRVEAALGLIEERRGEVTTCRFAGQAGRGGPERMRFKLHARSRRQGVEGELLPVWDVEKRSPRAIDLRRVRSVEGKRRQAG